MNDQLGLSFQAPTRRIWTVRELVSAARTALEREYGDVWVEGEISNFRPSDSGHLYFSIKDGDAQLKAVMFKSQARILRFRPENGLQIIARGRVTVYEPRGELQLSAEFLEPKGAGALQVAFEQLKKKLAAEGLFDSIRKKPLPLLPRCIGIITSARGAAIRDILNVLRRRHAGVNVLIYPAQVQGEAAAVELISGLKHFNRTAEVDVIIIARGGGSTEDLAVFNHEALARHIASSKIPVISAVGHETDFTISDFVADMRAPTPSAAAEIVVQSRQVLEENLVHLRQRLARAARYGALLSRKQLGEYAQHFTLPRMRDILSRRQQGVDDLVYRMNMAEKMILRSYRGRLDVAVARLGRHDLPRMLAGMRRDFRAAVGRLDSAARACFQQRRARWEKAQAAMEALSPRRILDRGYALIFDAQGRLVREIAKVHAGDSISARLADGGFTATVERTGNLEKFNFGKLTSEAKANE